VDTEEERGWHHKDGERTRFRQETRKRKKSGEEGKWSTGVLYHHHSRKREGERGRPRDKSHRENSEKLTLNGLTWEGKKKKNNHTKKGME